MLRCAVCNGPVTDEFDFWQGPGYLLGTLSRQCGCRTVRAQHPFTPGLMTHDQMQDDLRVVAQAIASEKPVDRGRLNFTRRGDRAFRPYFQHQNQRSPLSAAI